MGSCAASTSIQLRHDLITRWSRVSLRQPCSGSEHAAAPSAAGVPETCGQQNAAQLRSSSMLKTLLDSCRAARDASYGAAAGQNQLMPA
jgi:hypothetical protein